VVKLRKLHIDNYKMFKNFDISFVDKKMRPLPIIILAGINSSGKTTILEFINNFINLSTELDFIDIENDSQIKRFSKMKVSSNNMDYLNFKKLKKLNIEDYTKIVKQELIDNIVYIPMDIGNIKRVEMEFVKSFYFLLKEKDYRPSEVRENFDKYMMSFFGDLDLTFKYSHLDRDDNVWFENKVGDKFKIEELSTGEKTLISKFLYLFFLDYKNKVILIDEPELSLHPSWQNNALKIYENFAKKNDCQIIIATHSPHIIGSAENKSLRFLIRDKSGNMSVVSDIKAYGRDIEWVLEQMGVEEMRLPKIAKKLDEIQELINNQEFNKAESELDKLEYLIGENDKDILALRNDLAFERIDFEKDS